MNKYIILLLAVCLVSVSAFVKRDAPPPSPSTSDPTDLLETIKKQFADNINTDAFKKGITDAFASLQDAFDKLKPTETPKA